MQDFRAKHITNLYAFWDALSQRFSDLLIDNCASGGRRLDFEAMRRSAPLWRSDKLPWDPLEMQNQTFGLSEWLPYHGAGTGLVPGAESRFSYAFRSGMGSLVILPLPFTRSLTTSFWGISRNELTKWRQISDLFVGDYYPLVAYNKETNNQYFRRNDIWMAWQFHRQDLGRGVVQAFRRPGSGETKKSFQLSGLVSEATYTIVDVDFPSKPIQKTGAELMREGLVVEASIPEKALVFIYSKN